MRPPESIIGWLEEFNLINRLLLLRKQGKVGIVLAEGGKYWICENKYNPHGSKVWYSLAKIKELVEQLEKEGADAEKKCPGTETNSSAPGQPGRLYPRAV